MKSDRVGSSSSTGLSRTNDDSSVVSLKALVSKADPTLSARRASTSDDSGLIDLKKLMATAPPSSDALPAVLAPQEAGLFAIPAQVPPPTTTPSLADETAAPSSSGAKWFAVVSVGVMLILGGVLVVQQRGQATAQSVTKVALTSNESATPKFVEATPPAATPPVAEAKPAAPVETRTGASTPQANRQPAVSTTSRERATREAPVAKRPAEEKAPSASCDLMCEMARAAKKSKAP